MRGTSTSSIASVGVYGGGATRDNYNLDSRYGMSKSAAYCDGGAGYYSYLEESIDCQFTNLICERI